MTALLGAFIALTELLAGSGIPGALVILVTAVWAAVDADRLGLKRYRCALDHPVGVFFCVGLVWVVFFPVYLVLRSRRLNGELPLKRQYREPDHAGAAEGAEPGGPPLWVRATLIGACWLPVSVVVTVFVPPFAPLFQRLSEKGQLPALTRWMLAFSDLDRACLHLPALLIVVVPFAVAEAVVRVLRNRSRAGLWLWVVAVALASLLAMLMVVAALLLPVFRISSTVG